MNGHTVLLQAAFFGSQRHRDLADWLLRDAGPTQGLAPNDAAGADGIRRRLTAASNVRGYTALTMSQLWGNEPMTALFAFYDTSTPQDRARTTSPIYSRASPCRDRTTPTKPAPRS